MKSIILCADGTWNTPHGDSPTTTDTNVRTALSGVQGWVPLPCKSDQFHLSGSTSIERRENYVVAVVGKNLPPELK
jgi:hypothetical protein